MYYKKEFDLYSFDTWSGATYTKEIIISKDKAEEFNNLLLDVFSETPTETQINDFLWFEDEYIFSMLDIKDESDFEDEDEKEEYINSQMDSVAEKVENLEDYDLSLYDIEYMEYEELFQYCGFDYSEIETEDEINENIDNIFSEDNYILYSDEEDSYIVLSSK